MDGNKKLLNDIQFTHDFGLHPMGLGLLLKDSGLIGLATVILSVLALPVGGSFGVPLVIVVAYLGANDCKALGSKGTDTPLFQPSQETKESPPPDPPAPGPTPTATISISPPEQGITIDIPRMLASSNSSVIMGAPRAGKGYAVAQALRQVPETCCVWVLDPKNDPKERHYWARVETAHTLAWNNLKRSERPSDTVILEFVEEFLESAVDHGHHLLVIDEIPSLSNTMASRAFKRMMGLAASAASSGPSQGIRVWLLTQDSTCEQMGFSAQSRACFAQFAVSSDLTPQSWLRSFNQSTGAPIPALTGYIAYDGQRWGNSKQYSALPKAETIGIPRIQTTNSELNQAESTTEFDPTQPESNDEFNQFRELVCGGLEAGGNEIINKLWGAKPGGSKRYKAARERRDQFVARLSEY